MKFSDLKPGMSVVAIKDRVYVHAGHCCWRVGDKMTVFEGRDGVLYVRCREADPHHLSLVCASELEPAP